MDVLLVDGEGDEDKANDDAIAASVAGVLPHDAILYEYGTEPAEIVVNTDTT
jgi:hypothetical protein